MEFKIKWVDIDPTTLNMCLKDLEKKMTPKTKALLWEFIGVDIH